MFVLERVVNPYSDSASPEDMILNRHHHHVRYNFMFICPEKKKEEEKSDTFKSFYGIPFATTYFRPSNYRSIKHNPLFWSFLPSSLTSSIWISTHFFSVFFFFYSSSKMFSNKRYSYNELRILSFSFSWRKGVNKTKYESVCVREREDC